MNTNIENNAVKTIGNKLIFGLMNVMYEICTFSQKDKSHKYNIPENIEEYKQDILFNFKNLENVLSKNINDRKSDIEHLENKILQFEKEAMPFFAGLSFFDLMCSVITDYYQLKVTALDTDHKFPVQKTINDICSLINFEEKTGNLLYNGRVLISVVPFSMTKENYFDYILKSFEYVFEGAKKGNAENNFNELKYKFCSIDFMEDGPIKNRIIEISKTNFEEKDSNELLNLIQEIEAMAKDYTHIIGDMYCIYSSLMELLAIMRFSITKEDLLAKDFVIKDLFYSTKEMIENDTFEIMSNTILEKCEIEIENLIDEIEILEEKVEKYTQAVSYEKLPHIVKVLINLDMYFNANLEKNIFSNIWYNENDEKIDRNFVEEKAKQFIDYISSLDFSNKIIKIFKQQFFYHIPCPFNAKFLKIYFENVLSSLPENMAILTSYKLFAFTNPEKFSDFLDESDDTYHHDDCGCHI